MTKTTKKEAKVENPMALLFADLAKFQQAMTGAKKDANNPFHKSKYADLSSVVNAIKSGSEGLNIGFYHKTNDTTLTTILFYSDGVNYAELESSLSIEVHVPPPEERTDKFGKVKSFNMMQAIGSAITYAKRYTLQGLYGLPSEDDDGQSLQGAYHRPIQQQPTKTPFDTAKLEKTDVIQKIEKLMAEHNHVETAVQGFIEMGEKAYTFTDEDKKAIANVAQVFEKGINNG